MKPAPRPPMTRTATWTATDLPDACATVEAPIVDARAYRIVGEVARGGVGRILEAVDNRLQREVALVGRAMRRQPSDRYSGAAELAATSAVFRWARC